MNDNIFARSSNDNIFSGPFSIKDVNVPWSDVLQEDFYVAVYRDKYPVSEGHLLFVPKYNTLVALGLAFDQAFRYGKFMVSQERCDAFNVGLNAGEAAGQTIMWPHIHLIPRRVGDVEDPVGGVRNTIPGKGNYKK
jgi:hypothetical protein